MLRTLVPATLLVLAATAAVAAANHMPGHACTNCASHKEWPAIDGRFRQAQHSGRVFKGTRRSDELLGHHGSDTLHGKRGSDVLWGDWQGGASQPTSQHDRIHGGGGRDFIYGSHGFNTVYGGSGNDAISVHFGRGFLDCGPGRDVYHVPRKRKRRWLVRNCEKVDHRSEAQRGGGLKPLP